MSVPEPKYKNVDKWVYGEVKEIKLIGEDNEYRKRYALLYCRIITINISLLTLVIKNYLIGLK